MELKRHGAELIGLCPFHDDREPSLVVSPKKNLWHCLGACNAGGTAIDWVMRAEGVSFRHAVELLTSGRELGSGQVVKRTTVPKLPPPVERDADDAKLLLQVIGFYHETLKQSPEALGYLEKRGLKHPDMMERFQLGFANRTLGYRLPASNRVAGAELRGRLQKLGVYRESGHEHFNGCIVFPIFNRTGEVVQIYGRKIGDLSQPHHLYLPGPHRGVWNEEALEASKEIILCESLIDALTTVSGTGSPQFYATQTETNYYFGGKLIKNANGWVYSDRLASVGKFYPYGVERPSATTNGTEKFTGYFRDAETGNDYADQRYQSPGYGRFLTPDRVKGSAADPSSWNKYAYTEGDPINRVDRSGTEYEDCIIEDTCDDIFFNDPMFALTIQEASYDPNSPCAGESFAAPSASCLASLWPNLYQLPPAPSCQVSLATSGTPASGQDVSAVESWPID